MRHFLFIVIMAIISIPSQALRVELSNDTFSMTGRAANRNLFVTNNSEKMIALEVYAQSRVMDEVTGVDELEDVEGLNGIENIFVSGFKEFLRLSEQSDADPEAIMQGVQRTMRVALNREEARLETNLAFLATVGSTSPYVGLFGTVWGIMNSFRSLANMSQATLASVAPGISEALIATAMGLFAAIPAVIAYNRFSAKADSITDLYQTFSDELITILHRAAHSQTKD